MERVRRSETPGYKQSIIDRAAGEGRKLRQDEKTKINGPKLLLAHSFEKYPDLDPTGWWCSEKLDGIRGYWDGTQLISRQGNTINAPPWFTDQLPGSIPMDGELWMGRKRFQETISAVKRDVPDDRWKEVRYMVFDLPLHGGIFEKRMEYLQGMHDGRWAWTPLHHTKMKSRAHLLDELKRVVKLGAEGLMIREPGSLYVGRRDKSILKVKDFKDAEAVVLEHVPGEGKHKGRLGALRVKMPNGNEFDIGTGYSDKERENPPNKGSTVTYRFTELTNDGLPKCASFVCVRDYE